jgi:hypothetical protein
LTFRKDKEEFATPDEVELAVNKSTRSVKTNAKKEKVNKSLAEILGPNSIKLMVLPNNSAMKYFEK